MSQDTISKKSKGFPVRTTVALTILAIGSTGCVTLEEAKNYVTDPCSNFVSTAATTGGAIAGGIIANKVASDKHKAVATVAGAAAGGLIGNYVGSHIQQRRCEIHKIAQANQLVVKSEPIEVKTTNKDGATETKEVGLNVVIEDTSAQFDTNSSKPTANAKNAFTQIAKAYRAPALDKNAKAPDLKKMRLLLIGHTDDTGDSFQNANLSERRAKEVAKIFADNGFREDQIFYQGAGETLPIADNHTEEGRAKNRRVQIVDLSDDAAFEEYLASRQPNLKYYRSVKSNPVASSGQAKAAQPKAIKPVQLSKVTGNSKGAPAIEISPKPTPPAQPQSTASATGETATKQPVAKATNTAGTSNAEKSNTGSTGLPAPKLAKGVREFDFGGTAVKGQIDAVTIGALEKKSMFSIIPVAQASMPSELGSCLNDRPRADNGVKSLKTGEVRTRNKVADYRRGLFDNSWIGMAGDHLVALNRMAVFASGAPAHPPELLVFNNYKGGNPRSDYQESPAVNTYVGDQALLYRVFGAGPIQCMDIVIPNNAPGTAPNSRFVYAYTGSLHEAKFAPKALGK